MNIDHLTRLAEGATHGPWSADCDDASCPLPLVVAGSAVIADLSDCVSEEANARYIAAANPQMVLRLLAVVKAASDSALLLFAPGQFGDVRHAAQMKLAEALASLDELTSPTNSTEQKAP